MMQNHPGQEAVKQHQLTILSYAAALCCWVDACKLMFYQLKGYLPSNTEEWEAVPWQSFVFFECILLSVDEMTVCELLVKQIVFDL